MSNNSKTRPTIMVDLRKYRIRIHKRTLHCIGDPEYVLLLVNPEEHTLVILRSIRSDPRAHHIAGSSHENKQSFELYSRSLVESLREVCCNLKDNQRYRLYGEILPNESIARFNILDAVQLNGV